MTATVQTQVKAAPVPILSATHSNLLQRKCACGGTPGVAGECEECRKKREGMLQRAPAGNNSVGNEVPSIVHHVISSPGQPLDWETRGFLEPRFGYDFGHVRVHADAQAAESARAVNALAYTVGRDVVFSTGQYAPRTKQGMQLMTHELTHVVQQGKSEQAPKNIVMSSSDDRYEREAIAASQAVDQPGQLAGYPVARAPAITFPSLQRACLPAAQCATPSSTLTQFVEETNKKPENISKHAKRQAACSKTPPDAACTSDGHGSSATALTAVLTANYPSRLGYITGIYVDKDIPSNWGAYTGDCSSFTPPLPGGECTFVPDTLEAQAKLYQSGNATVGGRPRKEWLTRTIGTLTHETEHARFDTAVSIPDSGTCKFADHESNLSEMAAHLSQMHVYYRDALSRPSQDRFKLFYRMFNFWVKNGSEDISGIVKDLRCKCECNEADQFIIKTVESVSANQKWDSNERFMIHTELSDPKWALNWPVSPSAVNINDLPSTAPAPLKFE